MNSRSVRGSVVLITGAGGGITTPTWVTRRSLGTAVPDHVDHEVRAH